MVSFDKEPEGVYVMASTLGSARQAQLNPDSGGLRRETRRPGTDPSLESIDRYEAPAEDIDRSYG